MRWEIYDADGNFVNLIHADKAFVIQYSEENNYSHKLADALETDLEPEPPTPQPDTDAFILGLMEGYNNAE